MVPIPVPRGANRLRSRPSRPGDLAAPDLRMEGPWGQAVPTRSLNQKPCHLGEFRFSNPKVRPDTVVDPDDDDGLGRTLAGLHFFLNKKIKKAINTPKPTIGKVSK